MENLKSVLNFFFGIFVGVGFLVILFLVLGGVAGQLYTKSVTFDGVSFDRASPYLFLPALAWLGWFIYKEGKKG